MIEQRRRIDWAEVRGRIQASQQALERALTDDAARLEEIYRDRAARLARRHAHRDAATAGVPVLVFALGTDAYGLDLADVTEIVPFAACTPVPSAPSALLGVMNLRGAIRSVVALGRLVGAPEPSTALAGYVLLLRREGHYRAVRVDRLDRIRDLSAADLTGTGAADGTSGLQYLRGISADRVRVLDTAALFAHSLYRHDSA